MTNPDIKTCVGCGEEFERPARLDLSRWASRRYCSQRCGLVTVGLQNHGMNGATCSEDASSKSAAMGSQALLTRCIQYGLRHDSDLGMGYHAFMARARELGLSA